MKRPTGPITNLRGRKKGDQIFCRSPYGKHAYVKIAKVGTRYVYLENGQSFTLDGTEKTQFLACELFESKEDWEQYKLWQHYLVEAKNRNTRFASFNGEELIQAIAQAVSTCYVKQLLDKPLYHTTRTSMICDSDLKGPFWLFVNKVKALDFLPKGDTDRWLMSYSCSIDPGSLFEAISDTHVILELGHDFSYETDPHRAIAAAIQETEWEGYIFDDVICLLNPQKWMKLTSVEHITD